jgi:putative ABC transport system permease protein
MDSLFGLSMNTIMIVLLALLAVSLSVVAYVILRNRIVFLMGIRSIPRRMAQTVLIVIGLMLSTLIISAALTTGDTVDHSITNQSYTLMGHIDETVMPPSLRDDWLYEGDSARRIPADQYEEFQQALQEANAPDIDGSTGVLFEDVPVFNSTTRLSEPTVTLAGVDADSMEAFPDITSVTTGETLDLQSLGPDEVYMNKSAADQIEAVPGTTVQIYVQNEPHDLTVVDVVEDRVLTGVGKQDDDEGMVTRLDTLHSLFGHDQLSFVAVSSRGGIRDTGGLTDPVEERLDQMIEQNDLQLALGKSKQDSVDLAEDIGNIMASFFLVLGLFSIGAGVLLIIMIFVMLAAERRSEMGMARAVGMKRSHLVQMFTSEGVTYNIVSAMIGAALGILVAFGMSYLMGAIFASELFGLKIEPYVSPRTLVISYSLGVVLTFFTVAISSFRVSNLNIVSAIRGTEEPRHDEARRKTDWGAVGIGFAVSLVPGLGLLLIILDRGGLPRSRLWILVSIFLPGYLGLWLIFTKGIGFDWSWWGLALRGVLMAIFPPLWIWYLLRNGLGIPSAWIFSVGGLLFGFLFFLLGISSDSAFPFALGFSLMTAGAAVLLRLLKFPERPVYTAAGLFLIVLWLLTAGGRLDSIFGPLEGDFEMFFLSGVAMVTSATFVLIYNAHLLLAVVSRLGGVFGSILPALRTAVAYPLANRFRTGMTVAMISLVVFALTMMSTMNYNFDKLFLSDDSRGGWDVIVEENPNNPISDLPAALEDGGSSAAAGFKSVGRLSLPGNATASEIADVPEELQRGEELQPEEYPVSGMDDAFIEASQIKLDHRVRGYESDEAVWEALRTRDDVAVIDANAIAGGFGGEFDFSLSGRIKETEELFDPITLVVSDPDNTKTRQVELIGIMTLGASGTFVGLFIPDSAFRDVFGEPELSFHYVSLTNPDTSEEVAKDIESTLFTAGVQSESLKKRAEEQGALFRNFFRLMQGFMGLGLLVGIAAVGVIAFRTVVERRQHIGMLRAIGYKRSTVALSFLMESSFVTLLAIFSGVTLALLLAYALVTSGELAEDATYHVPWLQILLFVVITFVASLAMTFIPARQAASIPTAEALRYE